MGIQPIRFAPAGERPARELLQRFEALRGPLSRQDADVEAPAQELLRHLRTFEALDRQYGAAGPLPVEDAGELVAAALTQLAHLEVAARRDPPTGRGLAELTLGVALWAIAHGVPLDPVEPVANALAIRSNAAASREELAAVFGLMQGVIAHISPRLAPDLERSNPERPWRILHANLAITSIRTEDPALMAFAFDALDAALPVERGAFYGEALALALAPGVAPAVREALEARHRKWTPGSKTEDN